MGKFRDWMTANQSKEINEKVTITSDISNIAILLTETLHFANQIQLWHWLAKSGQKHTALGDFYAFLRESVDGIAETLIAQNILPRSEYAKGIDVFYSDEVITIQVNKYRELITELIDIVSVEKTDVSNIRDALVNIQEGIDKFIYQFDLE